MTASSLMSRLAPIQDRLRAATDAGKCWRCGCFHDALDALSQSTLATQAGHALGRARSVLEPRRYDCLGCPECWPAEALALAGEVVELPPVAGCPTKAPATRDGWPPLPGEYHALRYTAPVAVCTLHTRTLTEALARLAPEGLSIIGSLRTENLGIERIIQNVVANPHVRLLLLCGEDTAGSVGHLPGQSLAALLESGTDERGRIVGAQGKQPVLRNVTTEQVAHFRRQLELVDLRGVSDPDAIAERIGELAAAAPPAMSETPQMQLSVPVVRAAPPERLVLDPAGYVVIVVDRRHELLIAEHYDNRGVLQAVVEGGDPIHVVGTLLERGAVSRADHAAYLGRELCLARRALDEETPYVQDRAPEPPSEAPSDDELPAKGCGCGSAR